MFVFGDIAFSGVPNTNEFQKHSPSSLVTGWVLAFARFFSTSGTGERIARSSLSCYENARLIGSAHLLSKTARVLEYC